MKKVAFDPENHPSLDATAWSKLQAKAKDAQKVVLDWYAQQSAAAPTSVGTPRPELDDDIYHGIRKLITETVFYGRCAYCEAEVTDVSYAVAEHYRPKAAVYIRENGTLTNAKVGTDEHSGYPWLAYDWKNILPSCSICNNQENKGNLFPVANTWSHKPEPNRTTTEELNLHEKPLLLHPYFDEPAKHLQFDTKGIVVAKNNSVRGDATIKICGLDRGKLNEKRQKAQEGAEASFKALERDNRTSLLDAIRQIILRSENTEYSSAVLDFLYVKLEEEMTRTASVLADATAFFNSRNTST